MVLKQFQVLNKRDNMVRWSVRNRRAIQIIFYKICAHYGKNAPLRAHREAGALSKNQVYRRSRCLQESGYHQCC